MDYPVEVEVPPPIIGRKREVKLWAHLCFFRGKDGVPMRLVELLSLLSYVLYIVIPFKLC